MYYNYDALKIGLVLFTFGMGEQTTVELEHLPDAFIRRLHDRQYIRRTLVRSDISSAEGCEWRDQFSRGKPPYLALPT
jgi:hypothetical protein